MKHSRSHNYHVEVPYLEVVAESELQRLGGLLEEALVQLELGVQQVGVRVRLVCKRSESGSHRQRTDWAFVPIGEKYSHSAY